MNDKDRESFDVWVWDKFNLTYELNPSQYDDLKDSWQAACEYKQEEIFRLAKMIKEVNQWYEDEYDSREKLQAENAKLRELAMMVENNSLMPHKHEDYYTRLCCLSERASEVLKELDEE